MPYNKIRPIDRSCGSYRPGHQVHWIQAKKSMEEQQPVIDVSIVVHDDRRVEIDGEELNLTLWNHDPDRLQSALDHWGRAVWKPRYHVLSLPGLSGFLFNMAAPDDRTPCMRDVLRHAPTATDTPRLRQKSPWAGAAGSTREPRLMPPNYML